MEKVFVKIELDKIEKVINYLSTKPYSEVFKLVEMFDNLEAVEVEDSPM